jgi:hypothetical protein
MRTSPAPLYESAIDALTRDEKLALTGQCLLDALDHFFETAPSEILMGIGEPLRSAYRDYLDAVRS